MEPRKSKDNILSATRHDVEEMFLHNTFYIGEEGTSEADFPIFVQGLVDILYFDGDIKFCDREGVFSDELPVDAQDVYTTIN